MALTDMVIKQAKLKALRPRENYLESLVRAIVDPAPQRLAAGLGKCRLHQAAVFHDHDLPAEIAEHGFELRP